MSETRLGSDGLQLTPKRCQVQTSRAARIDTGPDFETFSFNFEKEQRWSPPARNNFNFFIIFVWKIEKTQLKTTTWRPTPAFTGTHALASFRLGSYRIRVRVRVRVVRLSVCLSVRLSVNCFFSEFRDYCLNVSFRYSLSVTVYLWPGPSSVSVSSSWS